MMFHVLENLKQKYIDYYYHSCCRSEIHRRYAQTVGNMLLITLIRNKTSNFKEYVGTQYVYKYF